MASLFAAALFFDGLHFVIPGTALHGKIVGLMGTAGHYAPCLSVSALTREKTTSEAVIIHDKPASPAPS